MSGKNIGFFVRHFTERGTEVAIYDYANYNEKMFNNRSFIICFTPEAQKKMKLPTIRHSYEKFNSRFKIIEINSIDDMKHVIMKYNLTYFYTLTHGGKDIYKFNDSKIWGKCKTIKHCVFNTKVQDADINISISEWVDPKGKILPHMIDLPNHVLNLKRELNIPDNKIIIGNYGGPTSFDNPEVHNAIIKYLSKNDEIIFLFMNNSVFKYKHKNIINLERNLDLNHKVKFINSCDAMIHGRKHGETFGLAVGEFSIKNKPVITSKTHGDKQHIANLENKAILFDSEKNLINIFADIKNIINSRNDWNAYHDYSPDKVMEKFNTIIFQ
jgi:hypothetical protein